MRFTKPSWVAHYDNHEPPKRVSIFSVSVHPDGSRVATGGLDAKIRIWSTSPILSAKAESKGQPKALSTLTMHNGPVLVVRWAASGKWLASGSDDTIVMIWDLDPNGGGKVWGSDDVNVEGWKALRRLTGHESDVVDCAWSPADRYLASVGLDSKVFIWCGYSLECIRRLDGHQGFVKGVCWDPVGEFLATQSDDKTVKIWRSTDWGLEITISKPFETSPGSAFFNRLSWSPDASYLCTSNAMNNRGAVFVAAVVERDTWNSDMSLVGHENTIQVASYNPRLFQRNPDIPLPTSSPSKRSALNDARSMNDTPTKRSSLDTPSKRSMLGGADEDDEPDYGNVFSVVALGADDRSISIWRTIDSRPLVVAKEAFDRQILDLCWASDGKSLWACSSDGTIAVLDFSEVEVWDADGTVVTGVKGGEMKGLASAETTKDYLKMFEFPWPPPLEANRYQPNGYQPNAQAQYQHASYAPQLYSAGSGSGYQQTPGPAYHPRPIMPTPQSSLTPGHVPPPINQAQKVTVTKSGKKRIQPTFLGGGSAVTSSGPMHPPIAPAPGPTTPTQANHGYRGQGQYDGGMDWAPDYSSGGRDRHSRKHSSSRQGENGYGYSLPSGSRVPGSGEARVLPPPPDVAGSGRQSLRRHSVGGYVHGLEVPMLRSHVFAGVPGELVFEARNADDANVPTEVICAHGAGVLWIDYVPAKALSVVKTPQFYAASFNDCTVIVYAPSGRRLMPTLTLDAPVSILAATGKFLMAITTTGSFHTWNVQTRASTIPPASIAAQVTPTTGGVTHAKIYDNGTSLITLASGTSIAWDPELSSWVRLDEPWWRPPSSSTSGHRSRPSDPGHLSSPVNLLSPVNAPRDDTPLGQAISLGAMETRLHAARLLGSPADYRAALLGYAGRLAEDNLAERADEVVRELCGPVFWDPSKPGAAPPSKWEPKVLGMNKRDLLKEVLPVLARGRHLSKMAQEWQVLLSRIESEMDV